MAIRTGDLVPHLPEAAPVQSGRWQVIFFYPRSATTHCQMQARRYQALMPEFRALGAQVVGVSSDTATQQKQFRDVCKLDFPLLADDGGRLCTAFGVLEDAVVENEPTRRAKRETFLIDPEGRVAHHWPQVDPNTNAADVLAELRSRL